MNAPEDIDAAPSAAELARAERYAEAIDAHARGTLDPAARAELLSDAARDPQLRELIEDAIAARELFGNARLRAPEGLRARILAAVDAELPRRSPAPRAMRMQWLGWATAAVLLVAVGASVGPWSPLRDREPTFEFNGHVYTLAEIENARAQLGAAFSMVDHEMDRTGDLLRDEVGGELRERVAGPLRASLGRTVRSIPYLRPAANPNEHSLILTPPRGEC